MALGIDTSQVQAAASVVTALGVILVFVTALTARAQLREAETKRRSDTLTQVLGIWSGQDFAEARAYSWNCQGKVLRDKVLEDRQLRPLEALKANQFAMFFVQLDAMEKMGSIEFRRLWFLLGSLTVESWVAWKEAVEAVRNNKNYPRPGLWKGFEDLAERIWSADERKLFRRLPLRPSRRKRMKERIREQMKAIKRIRGASLAFQNAEVRGLNHREPEM